jgi:DNA-binding MarR family transcriptional regulator
MPAHGKLGDVNGSDLVRTWRTFLERYHMATCALERALNDEHQLGMSEFEVLDRLAEWETAEACPGAGRRVQDLATSLHLSQSALSRVVARLEHNGLVMRGMCPNDRRGIYVHLTDIGRSKHAQALPTQRTVLAAHFTPGSLPAAAVTSSSPTRTRAVTRATQRRLPSPPPSPGRDRAGAKARGRAR